MNDEIKEILDNMFHIIIKYEEDFEYLEENKIRYILSYNKMQKLYDYITNLQQIEQEHKKINGELRERIAYLERSNDRREDTILGLRQEVYEQEDYKSRCEKASEYIDKQKKKMYKSRNKIAMFILMKLENILQMEVKKR